MRALALATLALSVSTAAFADREAVHRINIGADARAIHRVTIAIPAGDIQVRNSVANKLALDGAVRLRYDSQRQQEMQAIVNDVGLAIEVDGDQATISRTFGPGAGSWRAHHMTSFEVTIEVPPGTAVTVETSFGEVRMDGSFGDVTADMRAGEFVLRMPKRNVRSLTASVLAGENHASLGDRVVTREGLFSGRTTFSGTGRADVNLHITAGELHVTLTP